MPDNGQKTEAHPAQHQNRQPGIETTMQPQPETQPRPYRPSGKLDGKAAIITGGDSGIGRAVAVLFAKEGADIGIIYFNEHKDAQETKHLVEKEGRRCVLVNGDVGDDGFCE